MKILITIIFIALLHSCNLCQSNFDEKAWSAFTKKYSIKMSEEKLSLIGFGGAQNQYIEEISYTFMTCKKLRLDFVRELIVDNVEYLLKLINTDNLLTQYLIEVPFSQNRIRFGIMFLDENSNKFNESPYIAYVTFIEGKIGYATYNIKKDMLDIIHRETYEEALEIVNSCK